MRRITTTLRGQTIALAVGTAALVIVVAMIPIAVLIRSNAHDTAISQARYVAQGAADYMSTREYDDRLLDAYLNRINRRGRVPVSVVMADGDVLGAPLNPQQREAVQHQRHHPHHNDNDRDNLGWVATGPTAHADDATLVQEFAQGRGGVAAVVARVSDASVNATVRDRDLALIACAVALLALAWLAAELTGRRITEPLRRTADTAGALSNGDLDARAPTHGPREVARVAVELNALAERIEELLQAERETVADLSHRLRTPLTAVRLEVEGMPDGEHKRDLEEQVANLERTLTQVIRAARRPVREGVHPRCDVAKVAAERLAFWTPLAEDQGRRVTNKIAPGPVWVRAAEDDLSAALDALIENVIAHTPEGTGLTVALATGPRAVLDVLDEGPGIPSAALFRGRSDRGSSGLGLDIARSVAEGSGGSLALLDGGPTHGVRMLLALSHAVEPTS